MRRTRGFTLIELMIVIAIVAGLIGLMLAGLRDARRSARELKCRVNLEQIVTLVRTYDDEHGELPFNSSDVPSAEFGPVIWAPDSSLTCPEDPVARESPRPSYLYHPGEAFDDTTAQRTWSYRARNERTYVLLVDREPFHRFATGRNIARYNGEVARWNGTDFIGLWLP